MTSAPFLLAAALLSPARGDSVILAPVLVATARTTMIQLFATPAENVLTLKASYWLGF